ncbi:MAG: type 2 isopentenyl-diphosphate Delta-isomerase [Acidimicrobiales bacterium]
MHMLNAVEGAEAVQARKAHHLELALSPGSQSARDPGWDDVHLVPAALPERSLDEVDLATDLLGHRLAAPLVLAPMTGGCAEASRINAVLGEAAERLGLAVGVGSQRAALIEPALASTFAAVRRHGPSAPVLANIGICQLVDQRGARVLGRDDIHRIVEMVRADVLSVHLNVVQELLQPEGDRNTTRLADAIAAVVEWAPVPVLVKETGAGMTRESATLLVAAGVAGLDVGGAGGTSFARIEGARAAFAGDQRRAELGRVVADWGLPTAASVLEVRGLGVPVVATGGVRSGVDAAKALALGATAVGVGRIAIEEAVHGVESLVERLERVLEELRVVMLLAGTRTPEQLRDRAPVLTGFTLEWARQRGLR